MLKKILVYFAIPLIFAVCLSVSPGEYSFRFGAYPIQLCGDNPSYFGYCIDCDTELDCNNGENGTTHTCTQDQACQVNKYYAACTDINSAPDCSCPSGQVFKKADPYDDTKYLFCNDGYRYIFQCPGNEHFDPDTQECYTPSTTTTTTTTESPCPTDGDNVVIALNCTCFRYCFIDTNTYFDQCCNPGEIYVEKTASCDFYYPFSCTDKPDGKYTDIDDCNIYHICVNGDIFATTTCPNEEQFDEGDQSCVPTSSTCGTLVDCGICPDDETYIYIDCLNYYDCAKNDGDDSDILPYVPVLKYCPNGTCFSEETGLCEAV